MSDCMLVRRGGSGGMSVNGAVLRVLTFSDCTVTITCGSYSQRKTPQDRFILSTDSTAADFYFSIPQYAFGTFTVRVTRPYGSSQVSNTQSIAVGTSGKVYTVIAPTPDVILNSTFGRRVGYTFQDGNGNNATFESNNKRFKLSKPGTWTLNNSLNVSPYTKLVVNVSEAATIELFSGSTVAQTLSASSGRNVINLTGSHNTLGLRIVNSVYSQTDPYFYVSEVYLQ